MNTEAYLWPLPAQPTLPVRGLASRLPVNRIFCIGRNYQSHAIEMGTPVDKASMQPFYFCKDAGSLLVAAGDRAVELPYPPGTGNFHHEVELVVALGKPAFAIAAASAPAHIFGYGIGLDMTRRDLQQVAKNAQRPWDLGKNFEHGAVCGEIIPATALAATGNDQPLARGRIELRVNGELRQAGNLAEMIWDISEIIADLSRFYHLQAGDLIYTGTPEGVGPVHRGDRLLGSIEGLGTLEAVIR